MEIRQAVRPFQEHAAALCNADHAARRLGGRVLLEDGVHAAFERRLRGERGRHDKSSRAQGLVASD